MPIDDKNKQTIMSPLLGEGEDWEYGQSIDQEVAEKITVEESVNKFVERSVSKNPWIDDESSVFPDQLLIINDVYLYGVPAVAIKIEKPTDVFVGETLRTSSPILYSKGRENPSVYITLLFEPKMESLQQLRRIVSVLRRYPFTYLHNNKIAREIGAYDFETNVFALESGTIRSTEDTVGVIVLDLSFKLFNYKPFSNHHWYSGRLFRNNATETNTGIPQYPPSILDTTGYEADEYVLSLEAESQRNSQAKKAIENTIIGDAPVQLPSESPAWMMYANKLTDLTPEIITDIPSDYVGFSVKKFEYLDPPGSARAGKGNVAYWYNNDNSDLKEHQYPWKIESGSSPIQTSQEAYVDSTIDYGPIPNIIDADSLATYTASGTTRANGKNVKIDSNTALWLARMVVGEGGHSDESISALLWTLLYRWAFYYKDLSFLRAIRDFSQPVNPKWGPGGSKLIEYAGDPGASPERVQRRIRIQSMKWESIPKKVRSLVNKFRQGTLLPPDRFKSISKSIMTNWGSVKGLTWKRGWRANIDQYIDIEGNRFFQDPGIKVGIIQITSPKNPNGELSEPKSINLNKTQEEVNRKRMAVAKAEDHTEEKAKARDAFVKATITNRQAWIANEANINNRYYYDEDPAVRNIFYQSEELHISGNFVAQQSKEVAPNIVCSGISISFGHRLAPIKMVGQTTTSFQFLGAGNRAGQMVFTFAGKEGQQASEKLSRIFRIARNNAQYYGSLIPEAGSVRIHSVNQYSNEQNLILGLLGVEDIIVTNIEQQTAPDSPDKNQLIVEFIVQEFAEEIYQKQFVTSVDVKKKIIRSLMGYAIPRKETGTDRLVFRPDKKIAQYNPLEGRRFQVMGDTPSWFASLVSRTADICTNINEEMPPVKWKRGKDTNKTWEEIYNEWGASKLKGRVKNIDLREQNGNITTRISSIVPIANSSTAVSDIGLQAFKDDTKSTVPEHLKNTTYEEMYNGVFQYDGGLNTNDQHVDVFRNWLRQMGELADEAHQYIKDEENFNRYFGSVGKDILDSVTSSLNECYDDMDLPNVPGTELRLPPEFFVYDDSDEDPMVSEATSKENMELLLAEHVDNEIASITHYMQNAYLGGSYVSQNFPKILATRKEIYKDHFAESSFFSTWWNLFKEGGQPWEPIKYRYSDPNVTQTAQVKEWISTTQRGFGATSDKDIRLKYMDNLIRLSSYLQDGRHWRGTYETSPSRTAVIESVYGEAWDQIGFGPNPQYSHVDAAMTGHAEPDSSLSAQLRREEQAAINGLKQTNQKFAELPGGRTVRQDGAVTVGNPKEEYEATTQDNYTTGNQFFGQVGDSIATDSSLAAPVVSGAIATTSLIDKSSILGGIFPVLDAIQNLISGAKEVKNSAERLFSSFQNMIALKHPMLNRVKEEESAKNIAKIGTSIALGSKKNDISMRRAYPTFRIYFIEEDSQDTELYGKTVVRAFDDFYSYSAIQEIRIHRSRKIASDTAIIRMTNISGKLLKKRFGQQDITQQERDREEKQGIFADTNKEHPFEKMILQNGVKVQIRLGNAANPDDLETVFLGQIVEIAPSEDGKILELMLQGYGAELEAIQLGPFEDGPEFYSSQQVLSGAIIQDSIVNFGRRSKFNRFNPAEMRQSWTGGTGRNLVASLSPFDMLANWANRNMDRELSKYTFLNYPQDDNIYAPPPEVYTTEWDRFWNNACLYRPLNQTPWQIFKEHELRHPGFCSLAVPYGHSPRMTMFFGAKSQHYWARPPSPLELYMTENNYNEILKIRRAFIKDSKDMVAINKKFKELEATSPALANAMIGDILSASSPNAINTELGKRFGRYIPFRNFHYLDSEHHIIKNEIKTSVDNTYNEVTVLFFENENDLTDNDAGDVTKNISELVSEEKGVFSVKLDENIPQEYLRSYKEAFPGCVTVSMARRYAAGLLARHLKDMYKGELVIDGKASIKPLDIIQIKDQTIDMMGTIEVESVTHIFSQDTGFISIITPDLCVEVNDMFSASVWDVAAAGNAIFWGNSANTLQPIFSWFSHLGLMAGVKLVSWTQDGEPIVATPLTLGGKPFVSTILAPNDTDIFTQIHGKWRQYWDDLEDAWDKLDISEELFDKKIGISDTLFNVLGTGFNGGVEPAEPTQGEE